MKNIHILPTAEEFLVSKSVTKNNNIVMCALNNGDYTVKNMIEFAQMHVEAALKAASEATLLYDFKDEISNSYPLTNVK